MSRYIVRRTNYDIPALTTVALERYRAGDTDEAVLLALRNAGASPIASAAVLRKARGISMDQAKTVTFDSEVWADQRTQLRTNREWAERLVQEHATISSDGSWVIRTDPSRDPK